MIRRRHNPGAEDLTMDVLIEGIEDSEISYSVVIAEGESSCTDLFTTDQP